MPLVFFALSVVDVNQFEEECSVLAYAVCLNLLRGMLDMDALSGALLR